MMRVKKDYLKGWKKHVKQEKKEAYDANRRNGKNLGWKGLIWEFSFFFVK